MTPPAATAAITKSVATRPNTTGPMVAAAEHAVRNAPLEVTIVAAPLIAGSFLLFKGFEAFKASRNERI